MTKIKTVCLTDYELMLIVERLSNSMPEHHTLWKHDDRQVHQIIEHLQLRINEPRINGDN